MKIKNYYPFYLDSGFSLYVFADIDYMFKSELDIVFFRFLYGKLYKNSGL